MEKVRNKLLYGLNETDNWWYFSQGRESKIINSKLRELDTHIIRVFLFDKGTPDPVRQWELFIPYIQAVLDIGAKPMISFAFFNYPYYDATSISSFANRCSDVVWGCIQQWGNEEVSKWYWGIWNEPNNKEIGGGLTFDEYRVIYVETAIAILEYLKPIIGDEKPKIGGPAVDGFDSQWLTWIERFIGEIDNELIGFVSWHRYGDWRGLGQFGAPSKEDDYSQLLFAQTPDYKNRAEMVGKLIEGRDIKNICGELNVNSDHNPEVSRRFNQSLFGAVYYTSALLHLIRGGADLEMWWTASDKDGPYGMINCKGEVTPVYHAKKLFSKYIKYGDWVSFPQNSSDNSNLDIVVSNDDHGNRKSILLVNYNNQLCTFSNSKWSYLFEEFDTVLMIDNENINNVKVESFNGSLTFNGYGVAVLTVA